MNLSTSFKYICTVMALLASPSAAQSSPSIVFVTSTVHNGDLGGLVGADAICQARADAASPSLPGTFKAWLSDSTGSPLTRFIQSPGQYVFADGITVVANNWDDLIDGTLNERIFLNEVGELIVTAPNVCWTNTNTDGTVRDASFDCNDWSSSSSSDSSFVGDTFENNARWTISSSVTTACAAPLRLYCFQQIELPDPQISPAPTYEIDLSGCEFVADTTNIGTVTCTFEANGDSNHVVNSVLKGPDCSAEANTGLTRENPDFTSDGETSTYAVSVSINNNALGEGDEPVAFCIQAFVKAGGSTDVYAQLGQKIQLDVATDGSFSFDTTPAVADTISAEADALDTTLTVGAYQCDDSGTLTSSDLSLGDTLYICIDGDQDAVIVNAVNNLQAEKSGVSVSPLSIIDDGPTIANDAITAVYNTGTNKVIVTTILPLAFFEDSGAITVSGNADISAGGSSRQLSIGMGKEVISRPVVGADSAKFNLKVGVIPVSDPWDDKELWEDVKLKEMPNSAARVPQAFKISATAVFAALVLFWW